MVVIYFVVYCLFVINFLTVLKEFTPKNSPITNTFTLFATLSQNALNWIYCEKKDYKVNTVIKNLETFLETVKWL